MVKKVLVPTDGSEHARRAIDLASDIALRYDAMLYILHVISETTIPDEVLDYIRIEKVKEPPELVFQRKFGQGTIAAAEREARNKGLKEVQSEVVQGDPAEEIMRAGPSQGNASRERFQ
jgi:nucleotide-binding universal stress UspA family protein